MVYVLVFYGVSEYQQHDEKVLVKEYFNSLYIIMYYTMIDYYYYYKKLLLVLKAYSQYWINTF